MNKTKNFKNFNEVIYSAPKQLQFYNPSNSPKINSKYGKLHFHKYQDPTKILLLTTDNKTLAIFEFTCVVMPMKGNRFLMWYRKEIREWKKYISSIHLNIIDTDYLEPITGIKSICSNMDEHKLPYNLKENAIISDLMLSEDLDLGINIIDISEDFNEIEELIIIGYSRTLLKKRFLREHKNLSLFILKPKQSTVEIIPQEWYNKGDYDCVWQGVSRVARDPLTGKIFGEGNRLGNFILDDSAKHIEKWI